MILEVGLAGECGHGGFLAGGVGVGYEAQAAAGEDVEAEVAASFGPFVGLFGQDSSDETNDRCAVGEDGDGVGASADLAVQPFGGVVRLKLVPDLDRETGESEDVGSGGVGLVVNRVEHGLHCWPEAFRGDHHQVCLSSECGNAATMLPAGSPRHSLRVLGRRRR